MKLAAKLSLLLLVFAALVIVPYLAFGPAIESWAQRLVESEMATMMLVVVVIGLLVLDIVLPIPSSLVCIAAYALLPSPIAFPAVCVGLTLSYLIGHWLGARLGAPAFRAAFSEQDFQALGRIGERNRFVLIAVTRPLPVLAEMTALYLGSVKAPLVSSAGAAVLANVGIAALYGFIADSAKTQGSVWLLLAASMLLPTVFWLAGRTIRRAAGKR